MLVRPVDTLLNVADLNTKPLQRDRVYCLLALLGVRDPSNGYQVVGQVQLDEVRSRTVLRQQIRRLQHRISAHMQPNLLATALRVAVVLQELQGATASGLVDTLIQSPWVCMFKHFLRCVMLVVVILCPIMLQGCEPYETAAHAALVELWFIRVEGLMEQPVLGFSAIIVVVLAPWV